MNQPNGQSRKHQDADLSLAARDAVYRRHPSKALDMIERISSFRQDSLITLLMIYMYRGNHTEKEWALRLFTRQLAFCEQAKQLGFAALWLQNPTRASDMPPFLIQRIYQRRRDLEPDWNGVWENSGEVSAEILTKSPADVSDPEACLTAASQVRAWNPWLARYHALGGSIENPRYLKIWIARYVEKKKEPNQQVKEMLKKFTEVASIAEVRKFLRNITPTYQGGRKDPNWALAKYVFLIYCGCERLELGVDDWVHIAKSALYIRHQPICLIAQRALVDMQRTSVVREVLETLVRTDGPTRISASAKDDIGLRGNPIWDSLYHRIPVDWNARKILIAYSRAEANE